ncbi:SDR family NAD(P)-dependent oxidoreductase [Zavarzinia sp. CC-PAN008]|uniref:SDR family NAD(P)-dependent oxidoreductase n=1 Tax=Zavarzinia sp. CC-PAN008 TaxID=3243332 RepID=UPI003F745CB5
MTGRLGGKVALVTGGTSGIGRAIVQRFRAEGAAVWFTGRRAEMGEGVARDTGATFVKADAGSEADAKAVVAQVVAAAGRLDVLVNNAGGGAPTGGIADTDLSEFDHMIAVHVRGVLAHIRAAWPTMRDQGAGSIVNIASIAGHRTGMTNNPYYSIAKAAVLHLTRNAAMEFGRTGVRVNSISPGQMATEIFFKEGGREAPLGKARSAEAIDRLAAAFAQEQAIPRGGRAEDIANAALFLASDESTFMTGEDMLVEGGAIWGQRPEQYAAFMERMFEGMRRR